MKKKKRKLNDRNMIIILQVISIVCYVSGIISLDIMLLGTFIPLVSYILFTAIILFVLDLTAGIISISLVFKGVNIPVKGIILASLITAQVLFGGYSLFIGNISWFGMCGIFVLIFLYETLSAALFFECWCLLETFADLLIIIGFKKAGNSISEVLRNKLDSFSIHKK